MSQRADGRRGDDCSDCGVRMSKLSYMRVLGLRAGMLPTIGDDVSWAELKEDHKPGCYWYETRGHRVFTPSVRQVTPEQFNQLALAMALVNKG